MGLSDNKVQICKIFHSGGGLFCFLMDILIVILRVVLQFSDINLLKWFVIPDIFWSWIIPLLEKKLAFCY